MQQRYELRHMGLLYFRSEYSMHIYDATLYYKFNVHNFRGTGKMLTRGVEGAELLIIMFESSI